MFDLSATVIAYFPGLSVLTVAVPFFRVIVKPGPTVPFSFVGDIAPTGAAGAASASATTRPAASSGMRLMVLLCVLAFLPSSRLEPIRISDGGDTSRGAAAYRLRAG